MTNCYFKHTNLFVTFYSRYTRIAYMIQSVSLCLIRKFFLRWAHLIPPLWSWSPSTPCLKDTLASEHLSSSVRVTMTSLNLLALAFSIHTLDWIIWCHKTMAHSWFPHFPAQIWFPCWLCGVCEPGPCSDGSCVHLVFHWHLRTSLGTDHCGYNGSSTTTRRSFLPNILWSLWLHLMTKGFLLHFQMSYLTLFECLACINVITALLLH